MQRREESYNRHKPLLEFNFSVEVTNLLFRVCVPLLQPIETQTFASLYHSLREQDLLKGPKESARKVYHDYGPLMFYITAAVFCVISGMIKFSLEQPYSFSMFRFR